MIAWNQNFAQSHRNEEETQKIYFNGMKQMWVKTFKNGKLFVISKLMILKFMIMNCTAEMLLELNTQKVAVILLWMMEVKKEMDFKKHMFAVMAVMI